MTLFGVELAQPWFLLAALLAAPAVWWSRAQPGRVVFSSLRALPAGGDTWRTRLAWVPDALLGARGRRARDRARRAARRRQELARSAATASRS